MKETAVNIYSNAIWADAIVIVGLAVMIIGLLK